MGKIIVEDHTKKPDGEALINSLADAVTLYATSVSGKVGLSKKDCVQGILQAAEDVALYIVELGVATQEEISEMRGKAMQVAEQKIAALKQDGTLDAARKLVDKDE